MRFKKGTSNGWMQVFAAVGVYATAVKLLQAFTALGRRMPPPRAPEVPEPGAPAFVEALSMMVDTPLRAGGAVQILNNGDGFFPSLLRDIEAAEQSIHIMTYIWRRGRVSDRIFGALIERARRGVEVRLMYDGIGGLFAPKKHVEALQEAGGQVAVFSPLLSSHFLHPTRRNHRRAFIIDGKVGYTGGMSIADSWQGDGNSPKHWRDTMVRVEREMALALQETFLQLWTNIRGEILGPAYVQAPVQEQYEGPLLHVSLSHSPAAHIHPLRQLFWFSFKAARERIYVANSYFAPDRYIREVLMEKARAGLDVRLLLPSARTDNPPVRWASHRFYDEFLRAGIRIYEYTPAMMHAKHLVVDGVWTVIGSANIDIRSFTLNQENVLGIQDEDLGRRMEALFREDFERAQEIHLDAWRQRPWWQYLRAETAALLHAQY